MKVISKKRKEYVRKTPYRVDQEKFILNPTSIEAYILGFLWADGNIYKHTIKIELKQEDIENILPIFTMVGDWNYYERQRTKNGIPFGKLQASLNTSNKLLTAFLRSMDYDNKLNGPEKILCHLEKNLHIDFWHGFFDGDGSLYIEDKSPPTITLQFWSGLTQNWQSLINFLSEYNTLYKIWKYERVKTDGKIHSSSCLGVKNTLKIKYLLSLFYDRELIGLQRKYDKYLELSDHLKERTRKYPVGSRYYS